MKKPISISLTVREADLLRDLLYSHVTGPLMIASAMYDPNFKEGNFNSVLNKLLDKRPIDEEKEFTSLLKGEVVKDTGVIKISLKENHVCNCKYCAVKD